MNEWHNPRQIVFKVNTLVICIPSKHLKKLSSGDALAGSYQFILTTLSNNTGNQNLANVNKYSNFELWHL